MKDPFISDKHLQLKEKVRAFAESEVREAAAREHRSVANMVEMLIRRHCSQAGIAIPEQYELSKGAPNG